MKQPTLCEGLDRQTDSTTEPNLTWGHDDRISQKTDVVATIVGLCLIYSGCRFPAQHPGGSNTPISIVLAQSRLHPIGHRGRSVAGWVSQPLFACDT